jgi:hypothetical protein
MRSDRAAERWILLIHQIPPQPLYLRAKVRQQLLRVGAISVKKSVYALPDRPECLEDFQWIAEEVRTGGGEAFVCAAQFFEPGVDELLRSRSRQERDAEFQTLSEELERLPAPTLSSDPAARASLVRLRARWDEIRKSDFFESRKGAAVKRRIGEVEMRASRKTAASSAASVPLPRLAGKVWVTRPGVKIDRIASAWFVRRFVDPRARFRFDAASRKRRPGEVFFDVVGGDFTHEGDRCTLETLVLRTGSRDAAAAQIAEIVHDLDLKDGKFGRLEAPGVAQLLAGLLEATLDDGERLRDGFSIFDQLHRGFAASSGKPRTEPRKRPAPRKDAKGR